MSTDKFEEEIINNEIIDEDVIDREIINNPEKLFEIEECYTDMIAEEINSYNLDMEKSTTETNTNTTPRKIVINNDTDILLSISIFTEESAYEIINGIRIDDELLAYILDQTNCSYYVKEKYNIVAEKSIFLGVKIDSAEFGFMR